MKTVGLIGGISWESSLEYYRIINENVKERIGGLHSAKCILYSFDFADVAQLQHAGKWKTLTKMMIESAQILEKAGANFIVICANTMHKMADDIQSRITIPVLHIVDATSDEILKKNIEIVGLLGTRFTMEEDFYRERLREHGIEAIVPDQEEIRIIHNIIYHELCLGIIKQSSKDTFKKIIENLVGRGAKGIVLGCTEIPLLIKQGDARVPLFNTMEIHVKAAVDSALQDV